jgi:hypothetical protein
MDFHSFSSETDTSLLLGLGLFIFFAWSLQLKEANTLVLGAETPDWKLVE